MNLSIEGIARAFSEHDFKTTYPYLSDDVSWRLVGGEQLTGKESVIGACEQSEAYLAESTSAFRRFRTLVGESWVVVDSVADYSDRDGKTSSVASCDIYDFSGGLVSEISSFNIELTEP